MNQSYHFINAIRLLLYQLNNIRVVVSTYLKTTFTTVLKHVGTVRRVCAGPNKGVDILMTHFLHLCKVILKNNKKQIVAQKCIIANIPEH